MTRALTVVAYAVNGAGVGHLTRTLAVLRWMRRLALCAGRRLDAYVLTTSEAGQLALREGFATFKLPSKTVVRTAGLPKDDYLRLARQWVWHSLGLLNPDLLLVDTFPGGTFGELGPALDMPGRKMFIHRAVREGFDAAGFAAWLPYYDRILSIVEPGLAEQASDNDIDLDDFETDAAAWQAGAGQVGEQADDMQGTDGAPPPSVCAPVFPAVVRSRVRCVPPILLREPDERHDRATARRRLGVPDDAFALWLSAGGGGDATAERTLTTLMDALLPEQDIHLVVGAGPLFTGSPRRGARITWLTEPLAAEDFAGLDAAISAAGFNTTYELLSMGVPTALFAQEKIADDQAARLARAVAAGAALQLPARATGEPDTSALSGLLARLRDEFTRERLAARAAAFVLPDGARQAATYALQLLLDQSELQAAAARATPRLCRWLESHRPDAGLLARLWAVTSAVTDGDDLAEWLATVPDSFTVDEALTFLRRLPPPTDAADLEAALTLWGRLATALEAFVDDRARAAFLRHLPWSRRVAPDDQVQVLTRLLVAAHGTGDSLYRVLGVVERHTAGAEQDPFRWLAGLVAAAEEVQHGVALGASTTLAGDC
ncbi:MAG: hypothetical protein SNJ67_11635 [Chloracidobacterium sp.]